MTASLFSKIPKWCWYAFPVAVLLIIILAFRGGGRALWSRLGSPSAVSVDPAAPPALTPEKAEEKREEIKEELKVEEEKVETEADALRKKIKDKFGSLNE